MTESTGINCPKCQASNPRGAKFCSSCRESLAAAPTPVGGNTLPPQPPPQRPGLAGMVGQTGGKTESATIAADAGAVFEHLVRYIENLAGSEIKQQFAPQQIVAKIAYRDFLATGGMVVKVAGHITVTPVGPGQSTVSVTTKLDSSSTTTLWITFGCIMVFLIAMNMYLLMQYLFLGVLGAGLGYWLLATRPAARVSEALFDNLRSNAGALQTAAPMAAAVAQPRQPAAPPATPPVSPAAAQSNGHAADNDDGDDEVFKRIRKLAELKELGAITSEDYEAKKSELLSRL